MNKKTKLFGRKSEAVFDFWSVGHAGLYFVLTKFYLYQFPLEKALLIAVVIAYTWEFIERTMEDYDFNRRKVFFKEKECWMNRYVGDLISGLFGFFVGYFY
ncbi:hypothetical protein JW752_02640 [Candidatus Peregrinibacteria bacterium]|nr:hypothetical protein [Candidatus Peregrinibacteria bacterium]